MNGSQNERENAKATHTHRDGGDSQAYQCECKSDMRYMIVHRCFNIQLAPMAEECRFTQNSAFVAGVAVAAAALLYSLCSYNINGHHGNATLSQPH